MIQQQDCLRETSRDILGIVTRFISMENETCKVIQQLIQKRYDNQITSEEVEQELSQLEQDLRENKDLIKIEVKNIKSKNGKLVESSNFFKDSGIQHCNGRMRKVQKNHIFSACFNSKEDADKAIHYINNNHQIDSIDFTEKSKHLIEQENKLKNQFAKFLHNLLSNNLNQLTSETFKQQEQPLQSESLIESKQEQPLIVLQQHQLPLIVQEQDKQQLLFQEEQQQQQQLIEVQGQGQEQGQKQEIEEEVDSINQKRKLEGDRDDGNQDEMQSEPRKQQKTESKDISSQSKNEVCMAVEISYTSQTNQENMNNAMLIESQQLQINHEDVNATEELITIEEEELDSPSNLNPNPNPNPKSEQEVLQDDANEDVQIESPQFKEVSDDEEEEEQVKIFSSNSFNQKNEETLQHQIQNNSVTVSSFETTQNSSQQNDNNNNENNLISSDRKEIVSTEFASVKEQELTQVKDQEFTGIVEIPNVEDQNEEYQMTENNPQPLIQLPKSEEANTAMQSDIEIVELTKEMSVEVIVIKQDAAQTTQNALNQALQSSEYQLDQDSTKHEKTKQSLDHTPKNKTSNGNSRKSNSSKNKKNDSKIEKSKDTILKKKPQSSPLQPEKKQRISEEKEKQKEKLKEKEKEKLKEKEKEKEKEEKEKEREKEKEKEKQKRSSSSNNENKKSQKKKQKRR